MNPDLQSVLLNLISDVIFSMLVGALAFGFAWHLKRAQRRWMELHGARRAFEIYTSNLKIRAGGATPVDGQTVTTGFVGSAMDEQEYRSALRLRDALRPLRLIETLAGLFKKRLPQTEVLVCPQWTEAKSNNANLVFLGSPIYNSGTEFFLRNNSRISFVKVDGQRSLRIDGVDYIRKARPDDASGQFIDDHAVILRLNRDGRSIFICAGLGDAGTRKAVAYLSTCWKEIRTDCGRGEFIALLKWNENEPPLSFTDVKWQYREMAEKKLQLRLQEQMKTQRDDVV